MKILFFIGTLCSGGKERRLIELLTYLKANTKYDLMLVLRQDKIEYPSFQTLEIPYKILTDKYKKGDKSLHLKFYNICRDYKPDIIHTWGSMPAFVSILAVIILRIPHINSQITDAPLNVKKWSIQNIKNRINFYFSKIILSNTYAGLEAYKPNNSKTKVIYNGVNLSRFENLMDGQLVRKKYSIATTFIVIMVASFSNNKDYNKFLDVAKLVNNKRDDVSFIAIGDGANLEKMQYRVVEEQINNVIFTGKINDVESLVSITDIGLLFSNSLLHGEGISNAIIEYLALGKPVIANDAGGTNEIVKKNINGILISNETNEEIARNILKLLDDEEKRIALGEAGKQLIRECFNIDKMGKEFVNVYTNYI